MIFLIFYFFLFRYFSYIYFLYTYIAHFEHLLIFRLFNNNKKGININEITRLPPLPLWFSLIATLSGAAKAKLCKKFKWFLLLQIKGQGKDPSLIFFFFFNPNLLHLQNIQIIQEGLGTGTVSENILCFLSFFLSFSALPFFYTISCQQVSKWPSGLKPRYRAKSGLKEKGQTNESALRILHLQRGQLAFIRSHLLMHTQWKLWLQGRVQSSTPSTYRERQMQHSYQTGMQIRIHVFLFTVL